MNYPNPCDKCQHDKNGACSIYDRCEKWLTRYRYRQKQINAYAVKQGLTVKGMAAQPKITEKEMHGGGNDG